MIRFSDTTLIESGGHFGTTRKIMEDDGVSKWMLESSATVVAKTITGSKVSFNYLLHFWDTGEVCIIGTDHPMSIDKVPDDDVRELKEWITDNGWTKLTVHNGQLSSSAGLDFWERMHRAGIIDSDFLQKREDQESARMASSVEDDDGD